MALAIVKMISSIHMLKRFKFLVYVPESGLGLKLNICSMVEAGGAK